MEITFKIIKWLFGQQGAILISAGIGVWIALEQLKATRQRHDDEVNENRRRDRVKATLDYITRREWDKDYISTREAFIVLRDKKEGLDQYGQNGRNNTDEQKAIRRALNDYELVAVGIQQGILDEEFYKLWCLSGVLLDYKAVLGFIHALNRAETEKTGRETNYFSEFCKLAHRWNEQNKKP